MHDLRSHLNGIEMETLLLEPLVSDPKGLMALERIRKELAMMEAAVRSLSIRRAVAQRSTVSVVEVFQSWKSRSGSTGSELITWRCDIGSELIHVDMRMIADALCELLRQNGERPIEARGSIDGAGVIFEVRRQSGNEGGAFTQALEPTLPAFSEVIAANGGRYRPPTESNSAAQSVAACWFPCAL